MIKILGRADSINVRKILWVCDELNLGYQREDWGRGFQSPKQAEFLARNPNATIPVLIDDDFVLWQSNSILRYLANAYVGEKLYPTDPRKRALIDQWIDWQGIELNNSWVYALMHFIRHSPEHQDSQKIAQSVESWNAMMLILEQQLAKTQAYVIGAEFSLADIVIGLSVQRWYLTPFDKPDCPNIKAYYELLSRRAAFMRWGNNGQN
ncbi:MULTISPECIES: glutathione S-transferase family protein [unclassified Acinetobacter]|uniref:glutathione S-transferase family protein n=1 Tax=unclassified Acinetobacter TaxID=196816 RepID=UPI00190C5988|nr:MULTISPECIES: glutathione S-transferase [unclassified Acinetobacter]MBK0065143.1 glutathione S-transferase [Acinetobacter sp. S55]MBK0068320.1 glutathione S-transferase [Acinetobacter sp. S54]